MNQNSMKRLFVHFLPAFQWYHSLHHWWLQILLLSFDHFALGSFHSFEPRTPSGRLFWVDLGGSLPIKPISIMDLSYCVQMNP